MATSRPKKLFSARGKRVAFAVVAIAMVAVTPSVNAQAPTTCQVVGADTAVWAEINQAGLIAYYGHVIMYTRGCGLSPADVEATFAPVAGSVTTCDFRGTLRLDEAVCTGGRGAASLGTPVVVTAAGRSYGQGGADTFESSCTVVLPAEGRGSCPLPVK